MLRLAGPALRETVNGCDGTDDIPLFLGLPEPFEDRPDPAGEAFPVQLQRQSGVVFDTAGSRMFPVGRAAGLLALKEALDYLNSGTADEPGHRYADEPHKGEGLPLSIEALSNSLNGETEPVQTVFAGLNGEQFGAKEWGTAYLRHSGLFAEGFQVVHPVDCFGDVGAALGPMMIALAVAGAKGAYLPGPYLVWCPSDREPRACAYIKEIA